MKKLITILMLLLTTSCITHKDLAQIEANSYEKSQKLDEQQKLESFIQEELNNFFVVEMLNNGRPLVTVKHVQIIEFMGNTKLGPTYKIDAVLTTSNKEKSYIRTIMTVEVVPYYKGIGQISSQINPW